MGESVRAEGSTPLVSVVLTTMDRPQLLRRAIRSILAQTYPNFEVFVVDSSASSNATLVGSFADPRLSYVRSPPRGVNAARNIGTGLSKGRYIALLDDDDEWLPKKLEMQVELLQGSDASIAGAFASYNKIDPAKNQSKVVRIYEQENLIGPHSVGPASVTLVKREVFDDVGLFDEGVMGADDWEMWLTVSEKYRWACVPAILMNFYVTPNGLSADHPRQVRGHLVMLKKHPYLLQSKRFMMHYYCIVGQALCESGFMGKGRRYLLQSHMANRGLYPLVLFLMGALGSDAYNFAFSALRHTKISHRLEKLVERTS